MTERLRGLLAALTPSQLTDFVANTLCATHEQTISATNLLLLLRQSTLREHTLIGQTNAVLSKIASFLPLRMLFHSWVRASKRFHAVLNAPHLPHWKESMLYLHPMLASSYWKEYASTSLHRVFRHAHSIHLNSKSLTHVEPLIEKHHKLAIELDEVQSYDMDHECIDIIERIQCADIALRTCDGTPGSKKTDALVESRSFMRSTDFARFPNLRIVRMREEVKEGVVFPDTTRLLVLERGAARLSLPDTLRQLTCMNRSKPGDSDSPVFDMQCLKKCKALTTLSLSGVHVRVSESITLPDTLVSLDFCFEETENESRGLVDVSECAGLTRLTATASMLQKVLRGWKHVPWLTVLVRGAEFKSLVASFYNANAHVRLTIIATCRCVVYEVATWLQSRPQTMHARMKVRLAYLIRSYVPIDYRIHIHALNRDDLDTFDGDEVLCNNAIDAYILRVEELSPACECYHPVSFPAFLSNENLVTGKTERYLLTEVLASV